MAGVQCLVLLPARGDEVVSGTAVGCLGWRVVGSGDGFQGMVVLMSGGAGAYSECARAQEVPRVGWTPSLGPSLGGGQEAHIAVLPALHMDGKKGSREAMIGSLQPW